MVSTGTFLILLVPILCGTAIAHEEDEIHSPPADDMLLTPEQKNPPKHRGAYTWAKLWPNGVVPYNYDPSWRGRKTAVQAAIDIYNKYTCIRIVPKNSSHRDYITIYDGGAGVCNSAVGVGNGGQQKMSLGNNCDWVEVTLHEFGHAIGFMHEQQRPDRDNYISINYANVGGNMAQWFKPNPYAEANLQNIKYDYYSIMHYRRDAFSGNGKDTIITKDPKAQNVIGMQKMLSKCDLEKINKLYKCTQYIKNDPSCLINRG